MGQCLRPSSDDFPKLAVRHSPGPTRVRESERVVGETITTKTEEYTDEETGLVKVRTVEIVEKLIEKEVLGSFFCTACLQRCFHMLADLEFCSVCSIYFFFCLCTSHMGFKMFYYFYLNKIQKKALSFQHHFLPIHN